MGKHDKDRYLKELAIRYCLSREMVPFLEVITSSITDLSDTVEVLTDLDVVGIEADADGTQRRVFFDCKSSNRMSAINRAFWAAGVKSYVGYQQAYVILKSKPLINHRLSALELDIDLHDENSFRALGRGSDESFALDNYYQSALDRWEQLFVAYTNNGWSKQTYEIGRHQTPLSKAPWATFRRLIAELRDKRGFYDPDKSDHIAVFLDVLASAMVLWGMMGRDIRRFYEPTMNRQDIEQLLRYYIWGGKESYEIRQKLRSKAKVDLEENADLPAWNRLIEYTGVTVTSPRQILSCAHVFKELSIRSATKENADFDAKLKVRFERDDRLRQFSLGMNDYLVEAGALPKDMGRSVETILLSI